MSEVLVPGLTQPRAVSLERSALRIRESSSTQSGWRMTIESAEGAGSILLLEAVPGGPLYRGDGIFLGWTQERMAAAYAALRSEPETESFETQQLG